MPRRKYDTRQEAAIALLAGIHLERVSRKAVIRAQIEAELRDQLNDIELRESRAANEALALGVSKTDIGRTVGTANFTTISDMLARTAGQVKAEDLIIDPLDERYSFDAEGKTLMVTYSGEAWTNACWEMEWDERAALNAGLDVATFGWGFEPNGRPILQPITPDFLFEFANRHPVVAAVMRDDTEAVEWLEKQLAAN